MAEPKDTAGASDSQPSTISQDVMKRKASSQASFTRTYNSLIKLAHSDSPSVTSLNKTLEDLEDRFQVFESRCEDILNVTDEANPLFQLINDIVTEKYELLIAVRAEVFNIGETSLNVSRDTDTEETTNELVKSFKASLTLPKPDFKSFNGNSADYSRFMSYIETFVETNVSDKRQCLSFMIDSCTDVAYDAISFLSQCSNAKHAYKEAKTILKELFGGKHQITRAVLNECTNGPSIKASDVEGLKRLSITLKKAITTLSECGSSDELTSSDKLVKIYSRLPRILQNKWNDKLINLHDKDEKPALLHMNKLIESFVKSIDNEYNDVSNVHSNSSSFQGRKKANKPVFVLNEKGSTDVKPRCMFCNGLHYLNQCDDFLKLTLQNRYDFVSSKQLCRNCLHTGHIANQCKRGSLCKRCRCKHNDVLHDPYFSPYSQRSQAAAGNYNVNNSSATGEVSANENTSNVVLKVTATNTSCNDVKDDKPGISCVDVIVEGSDAMYKCKAVVDQKSSANLITEKLAKKLNLSSTPFESTFNVATGSYAVKGNRIGTTKVYSKNMVDNVTVNNLLTVKSIPISVDSLFSFTDIDGLSHMKGVDIPQCTNDDEIDLLIGSGVPKAFHQLECRKGHDNEIYAVRLALGWDLVGPKKMIHTGEPFNPINSSVLAMSHECFYTSQLAPVHSQFNHDLEKVFQSDFADCSLFNDKVGMSCEDKKALRLVNESMHFIEGSFCVGVPWKQNPTNLPSCKEIALKRLESLKQRLQKDDNLLQNYTSEMQKFIDNDFIEQSDCNDTDLCHYIPHHPVWHPRKGSMRIVWDCALSLNDFVYEGPDLMNSLVEVLIRFRRFRYAITSDIRKMYLNVKMPVRDRGAFRMLWWPNGDLSLSPSVYRATVHIYGAKSSGFIANHCIQKLANNANDSLTADALMHDLYVDDQVSSIQSENDAITIVKGMRSILNEGGFHLTKFVSNCRAVMNEIPECDHIDTVNLDLRDIEHSVLGLQWSIDDDMLRFPCVIPEVNERPTRRSLLSLIARIYDPLGIISPATLPIKILLQEKSNLDWDKSDDDIAYQWQDLRTMLQTISTLSVPRCYKPNTSSFDKPNHVSLHGFSDASQHGYSAVVYIRQVSENEEISVSFVIGKSRVAPKFKGNVSQATIPKLELNASALLVKLVLKVKKCIGIDVTDTFYWSDSKAVISCINDTSRRFPVYWANRLAIIHSSSQPNEWNFVPTKLNPADVGSRIMKSNDFSRKMKFWINGPTFLLHESDKWPSEIVDDCNVMITATVDNKTDNTNHDLLSRIIQYYSDLDKLLRVIARLIRFMSSKTEGKKDEINCLDLEKAQMALIRYEQHSLIPDHIKRLKPFTDNDGIQRVTGRLLHASHLTYDTMFPIILPKNSHLTKLIIRKEHVKCAHMGPLHVLSNLRKKFWIVNGRTTVKKALVDCRKCIEENARSLTQQMSPLPKERLEVSYPFQHVGLDYFGPFLCKVRRQRIKRYGCIFVCLATRAIHLECVNTLESSAFLCALTRFIARRGLPAKIFSDNATNFCGSQEELKNIVNSVNESAYKYCVSNGILWHFHPPHGSHHGGHYERMIRSVRRALRSLTNEQEMTEDSLTTFLCEAEKVLNDRPLTALSDNPGDEIPLTPNLILLLRGNSCRSLFEASSDLKRCHKHAQHLANEFWSRWLREYVPTLQLRQKWLSPERNLCVGDLVFMSGEGFARGHWPIARVTEVIKDNDGLVRKVVVKDKSGLRYVLLQS